MCQHYQRQCWVRGSCCSEFWPCHRCHDENSNHQLASRETCEVKCLNCQHIQTMEMFQTMEFIPKTFSLSCRNCGHPFGEHGCEQCHYIGSRTTIHCARCQMCHLGTTQDLSYCEICEICIKRKQFASHQRFHSDHPITFRGASKLGCPICLGELSQGEAVILQCGHILHIKCVELHLQYHDRCPTCAKPMGDRET